MKTPLFWYNLTHFKRKFVLALIGITFALVLMFAQFGLYQAALIATTRFYEQLDYDIILTDKHLLHLGRPGGFSRKELYHAASLIGAKGFSPVYIGFCQWATHRTEENLIVLAVGIPLEKKVLKYIDLSETKYSLRKKNTLLIDRYSRPEYLSYTKGSYTEINNQKMKVVGNFRMGAGFIGGGVILLNDQNFFKLVKGRNKEFVNFGLIRLQPGADVSSAVKRLNKNLPEKIKAYERSHWKKLRVAYWDSKTPIGLITGMGAIIAFIVGLVIIYQVLYNNIVEYLQEYATLRAMGYTTFFLQFGVLKQAWILVLISYIPATIFSLLIYQAVDKASSGIIPVEMTQARLLGIFLTALAMGTVSAIVAIRKTMEVDCSQVFGSKR